jgi:hypothetical protein
MRLQPIFRRRITLTALVSIILKPFRFSAEAITGTVRYVNLFDITGTFKCPINQHRLKKQPRKPFTIGI